MLRFNVVVVFVVTSLSMAVSGESGGNCTSPEASQFDFWIGEWEVSWEGQDGVEMRGTNTVTKTLGGCVVHESFKDPNTGFEGMSYTVYDTTKNKWLQTWVDNSGSYLDFAGEFKDDTMILQRVAGRGGKEFKQRMRWYNIRKDAFDWNWERSDDDGATWKLLWHIKYKRAE